MEAIDKSVNNVDKDISNIENYVMSVLKEVIGLKGINRTDKFVDIGGNSISLAIIAGKIDEYYEIQVNKELFFDPEKSTVRSISEDIFKKYSKKLTQ